MVMRPLSQNLLCPKTQKPPKRYKISMKALRIRPWKKPSIMEVPPWKKFSKLRLLLQIYGNEYMFTYKRILINCQLF